jgi:hypothetical protein
VYEDDATTVGMVSLLVAAVVEVEALLLALLRLRELRGGADSGKVLHVMTSGELKKCS